MITKKGSTKIVSFMTPGAGFYFFARVWPYKSYSENAFFSTPRHRSDKLCI